ncbi:MAG: PDZ domain-containing protein [Ruminococcus sp.]|jgi:carboxyl-terminal processing protease|nr:PDZ domain-containing protein [Ruminococcus sp.]
MNKKISVGVAVGIMAIACAVTFLITTFFSLQIFNDKFAGEKRMAEKFKRLREIDEYVVENSTDNTDNTKLLDSVLEGYVAGLDDKYARYITEQKYQDEIVEGAATFVGLGIGVTRDESGYSLIQGLIFDSPADKEGIEVGDLIIAVDGENVLEKGYLDAMKMVRGDEGTVVKFTIRHFTDENKTEYTDREISFTRVRESVTSVFSKIIDDEIGYIKISHFSNNTLSQFEEAYNELTADGAKCLILDIRDNGGGLVNISASIINEFLGNVGDVFMAEYGDGRKEVLVSSNSDATISEDIPVVMLVNENTASSSEILACSLRDFRDVKLIGTKTFGKAIMQDSEHMSLGGMITVTVAEIKPIKSPSYNGIGLVPDIEVLDSGVDGEDLQLDKAVEYLKDLN